MVCVKLKTAVWKLTQDFFYFFGTSRATLSPCSLSESKTTTFPNASLVRQVLAPTPKPATSAEINF